jgi:putative tryptophan/tyrosine transport system substrate-binding protein
MRRREFIAGLGSAAAWPLAAQAQRPTVPVIGFLSFDFPRPNADYVVAFRQGLADAGYVEGRNVAIEYRWANRQGGALRPLAAETVVQGLAEIRGLYGTGHGKDGGRDKPQNSSAEVNGLCVHSGDLDAAWSTGNTSAGKEAG